MIYISAFKAHLLYLLPIKSYDQNLTAIKYLGFNGLSCHAKWFLGSKYIFLANENRVKTHSVLNLHTYSPTVIVDLASCTKIRPNCKDPDCKTQACDP